MAETKRVTLPPRDYQPSKAELEEEQDMPGADMETLRRAFFRPVEVKREPSSTKKCERFLPVNG